MATEKTDVVIIGVGAAGGILAAELGKAGMKVIGLERGPRLTTQDFNPHDELRYFQRQDLRPNIKRQPVTWRPNKDARANPMPVLNNGNQAGGGTVHYGAVSWRMHEDDFRARSHTIERYGASAIPADSSLADWPLSYADLEPYLRPRRIRARRVGQGRQSARKEDRRRQRVRSTAPSRISAAAVASGPGRDPVRRRRAQARLSPVLDPACHHLAAVSGPAGLHLLRLLPSLRLSCRREVVDPRHQAAGGRCHRQFQAPHRGHLLSHQQRQQRPGDRRLLLGTRRLGQRDRGRAGHRDDVHLRQYPSPAAVEDGEIPQRSRQFERPPGQARDGAHDGQRVRRLRRPAPQRLYGAERAEAYAR